MCSCQNAAAATSEFTEARGGVVNFRVDDMTCGHCAATIAKAIETGLPGTSVSADPASKVVSVRGASDYAVLKTIVTSAGYTPSAEVLG